MIIVTQIPFLFTLYYSTQSWNLVRPGSRQFVGLNNYIDVFKDSQFWTVALNTVILIVGDGIDLGGPRLGARAAAGPEVPRPRRGAHPADHPVPHHAGRGALIWKTTMLDPTFGIVNCVLRLFGIGQVDWIEQVPARLGDGRIDLAVDAVHDAARSWPACRAMPKDILEAGRVDGAGRCQLFRELTLPHLRRFIELGIVLGAIYLVNTFDAIYMMTQGGPGIASANLPFYIYQRAFLGFDIGQAAAMGVVVVIVTIVIATFALRLIFKIVLRQRRRRPDDYRRHTTAEPHHHGGDRHPCRQEEARQPHGPWASSPGSSASVLLPGAVDGADLVQAEASAYTNPPTAVLHPDAGPVPAVFDSGIWPTLRTRCSPRWCPRFWSCCWPRPPRSRCRCARCARRSDVLFFFISTKMLPVVAAILPHVRDRARTWTCWTTSGPWSSSTRR